MKERSRLAIRAFICSLTIYAFVTQATAQNSDFDTATNQPMAESGPAGNSSPEQSPAAPAPQKVTEHDEGWHFDVSPYLWFAGVHGTAGALGHDVSVHAGFTDIFNYLNIGLMGAAEARYKKFGAPVDFMWMKLSDDKSLPFDQGTTSAKAKITQTLFAPKVSYRLVDGEMLKVDGNFGIRYFHLGTTLDLNLARVQPSVYQSANWVDYTGGARIVTALSPKILVTVLGDAGAGGADLDYQVGGALGYKLKPNVILQGGWRYLNVNYRPNSTFVYDMATSGLIIGVTFNLK